MPIREIKNLAVADLKLWSENHRDPLGKKASDFQSIKSPLVSKDMVYKYFLNIAKEDLKLAKSTDNYFSLTTSWLNGNSTIEALLGKFAHGNIDVSKEDVIASSIVVGQIIKYYFSKDNPLL